MKAKFRVLVVEDEVGIRQGLCDVLVFHGYDPAGVASGEEGLTQALSGDFALVLLDVMLPGMSGFDVCERLRAGGCVSPILMLTAKGAEDDIVRGLGAGADDYVTKPFSVRELVARVQALLRRNARAAEEGAAPFEFGPWTVDPREGVATRPGTSASLTEREVVLLQIFAREPGRILSRRTLLREAWGVANPENLITRTVDMHIAKLRKKIDDEALALIETVRSRGYRFREPR